MNQDLQQFIAEKPKPKTNNVSPPIKKRKAQNQSATQKTLGSIDEVASQKNKDSAAGGVDEAQSAQSNSFKVIKDSKNTTQTLNFAAEVMN